MRPISPINATSGNADVSAPLAQHSSREPADDLKVAIKQDPGQSSATCWPEDNHDRFQQARANSRRASIAEVYEAVNHHPVPGSSAVHPSIEDYSQAYLAAWQSRQRHTSNTSESLRHFTPPAAAPRRSSIALTHYQADLIAAEDFSHVPRIDLATYNKCLGFYEEHRSGSISTAAFPEINALNAFVQLYFEHHHGKLPLLHKATFSPSVDSWLLVLALAAVGCEYSELCSMPLIAMFEHLAMRAVSVTMTFASRVESLPTIQSIVLFLSFLFYDGSEEHLLFLQHHRSLLNTICGQLLHRREADVSVSNAYDIDRRWRHWCLIEQERRVVSVIAQLECLQSVVFDIPANMVTRELIRALPCHEDLWSCSNALDWDLQYRQATMPTFSVASILASGPLTDPLVQSLSDTAFLLIFYILHVAERSLQDSYQLWIRPRLTAGDRSDGSVIHKVLDADMQRLEADSRRRSSGEFEVSFHLLTIIRLTPFSSLCILAGLRDSQDTETVRDHLYAVLKGNSTRARLTLLHAGRLFSHFRNVRIIARSDLQAFLAASLYLWIWTKTIPSQDQSGGIENPLSSPEQCVRIDQGLESPLAQRWVDNGAGMKAQVAGVGVLVGSDAASRVLKEAAWVFRTKAANSTLGRSMAESCIRVVLGS